MGSRVFPPRPRPARAAEPMDARWGTIAIFASGAIALQLVQPVQRHIQPVATFVLHDGHLESGLTRGDRLDAAVDPDAVLEMDHVVAQGQRPGSTRWRGLAIAAWASQASGPA